MGFNPRDYMTVQQAQQQSQQPMQTSAPPAPSPYYGNEAYSTTVMPETGEPGPNRSLAGNINFATPETAQKYGQRYGARVVTSNMGGGPVKRSVPEYGLDFGRGDVLNAGVIASRDTGNYDKWYDAIDPATGRSLNNRNVALQDELTYGAKYNPQGVANARRPETFGGGINNQFSPVAGQDYRPAGGTSPLLTGGMGGRAGSAGGSVNTPAPAANRYGGPARPQPPRSPYGAMARQQPQRARQPITSAYRPVGVGRAF